MEYVITTEVIEEQTAATVTAEQLPIPEIGRFIGEAFGLVMAALQQQHVAPAGPPFARYTMHDKTFDVTAGFPVAQPTTSVGRVHATSLPACTVATTMHIGAYGDVSTAYAAIMAWLPQHGFRAAGDPWEVYLDGPEVAQPRTIVRVPCTKVG